MCHLKDCSPGYEEAGRTNSFTFFPSPHSIKQLNAVQEAPLSRSPPDRWNRGWLAEPQVRSECTSLGQFQSLQLWFFSVPSNSPTTLTPLRISCDIKISAHFGILKVTFEVLHKIIINSNYLYIKPQPLLLAFSVVIYIQCTAILSFTGIVTKYTSTQYISLK